jgi:tetratricopeptide (TPR) repeat protein
VPNSYSQETQQTCPHTNQPFVFEVWLIVDRSERPDLIDKVKAGALHTIVSPYTGAELGFYDAPLLIFQPDRTPPLLFSPARETTQEQDQQHALELVEQLRSSLGARWRDEWLRSFNVVNRDRLPSALDGDPEVGMKRLAEGLGALAALALLGRLLQGALEGLTAEDPADFEAPLANRLQPDAELRAIIQQLQQPPRGLHDMPRRVELCRRALELLPKQGNEPLWAALQVELGNALWQNPLGDRAQNLEDAIDHYQRALTVYTREAYPADWAVTQHNLGAAYAERIAGERRENLERAIDHFQRALAVYTREAYPERWASTQHNLGAAYAERIAGERRENLERAIDHYQRALAVYTREAYPADWAATQNNLGAAYRDRIAGERRENLERAIDHYQRALAVYTREAYPADWAATQNNLGAAYRDRIAGERRENLERAIDHYQRALAVYTREAYPERWAMTQNNLAAAYADRIAGERRENLERAIDHYQRALAVYTREAYPERWAMTQNNLAAAYADRIAGERRENLERAIDHYQRALAVYTREAYPADPEQPGRRPRTTWGRVPSAHRTTWRAYADRIAGERRENLERAIDHNLGLRTERASRGSAVRTSNAPSTTTSGRWK